MKTTADLVLGWIKKADSDMTNVDLCIASGQALDTACFHAQQAAEKLLKAYLIAVNVPFPLTHNLEKPIKLCEKSNPAFSNIKLPGATLTPYAVSMRYDEDFRPTQQTAEEACDDAIVIRTVVLSCLPVGMAPP